MTQQGGGAFHEIRADVPRATYRVQLNARFTFADARAWVGYLDELGVSHLYASPFFKARPGSEHGYDLTDHNALNPEVGSRAELGALSVALAARGMGVLLDFVPNHMGIGAENAWWADVLENGPSSLQAPFFDVDWAPVKPELRNKVLLPVLGDHYGRVLERGELTIEVDGGAFSLRYYEQRIPLNPRTYTLILEPLVPALTEALGEEHEAVLELQSILTGLRNLPTRTETRRSRKIERRREKEILKRRLAALVAEVPEAARALAAEVTRLNGQPGDPRSFDPLDLVLEEQAYRLSYWRTAAEEINYRRFFDINHLAAIRMENPEVFEAAHRLLFELLAAGQVSGLRIDHPDGLWDPAGYFEALQRRYGIARTGAAAREGEGVARRPLYVVVEKILSRGETLPGDWAVHGTSGYDFACSVGALFVDPTSEAAMTATYERFTGQRRDFDDLVYEKKRLILKTSMASELNVLAHALNRLTERDRRFRDFTLGSLTGALREVIACFPVYRTYIHERTDALSDHDRVAIHRAIGAARRRNPATEGSVFSFLRAVLTLDPAEGVSPDDLLLWRDFVMKFQQLTGPVMAKGVEDTAFYVYNRLTSLNEVGGEPERYGASVAAFHRENATRQRAWPHGLLATTTHDTKRSEDVRARISVLSELPAAWDDALARTAAAAAGLRGEVDGRAAPDPNEEYLLYQALIGSLPLAPLLHAAGQSTSGAARGEAALRPGPRLPPGEALAGYVERIVAYLRKATREAKVNTSWLQPNAEYDAAVERFVRQLLAPSDALSTLLPLARVAAYHGMWGALSQLLLKLTSPGVPDIYQGTELWDDSLVDPDNRRPVDFGARAAALEEIAARRGEGAAFARELLEQAPDGRIKLFVLHAGLSARRRAPELFGEGAEYVPLLASGERAEHAVVFARKDGGRAIVAVASRLTARMMEGRCDPPVGAAWRGTWIPAEDGASYVDLLTGAEVRAEPAPAPTSRAALPLDRVLEVLPVALLARGF